MHNIEMDLREAGLEVLPLIALRDGTRKYISMHNESCINVKIV